MFATSIITIVLVFSGHGLAMSNYCQPNPTVEAIPPGNERAPDHLASNLLVDFDCAQPDKNTWLANSTDGVDEFMVDMGCVEEFDRVDLRQLPFASTPEHHGGTYSYTLWASPDGQFWFEVHRGRLPNFLDVPCADQPTWTIDVGRDPKRFLWFEGDRFWGRGGGLATFRPYKSKRGSGNQ